jgi:hypothetical protein
VGLGLGLGLGSGCSNVLFLAATAVTAATAAASAAANGANHAELAQPPAGDDDWTSLRCTALHTVTGGLSPCQSFTPHSSRLFAASLQQQDEDGCDGMRCGWGRGRSVFLRPRKTSQLRRISNRPNIVSCTSALEIDSAAAPRGTFVRRKPSFA